MLLTVADLRDRVAQNVDELITGLQGETGRSGEEEALAWRASLPRLVEALDSPATEQLHIWLGLGHVVLEYRLPAASSWCDAVLLGRRGPSDAAVVIELKDWATAWDRPGPYEGLMERAGQIALHPSEQVRGYVEYTRRFHSAVQARHASVAGCVLFTKDSALEPYAEPPNDRLVREYPCFSTAGLRARDALASYVVNRIDSPGEAFARAFVSGHYQQDRGFVRQIGKLIQDPANPPFALLDHQRRAYAVVRSRLEETLFHDAQARKQVIVVEGPPGSGKSVLAGQIWAGLVTDSRLPSGDVVLTTTSTAQASNWGRLLQQAGRAMAARGVVKRASSYVPITTQRLGRLRESHGNAFLKDPEAWRDNVARLRSLGERFQDGARDDQYLISIVDEAHGLINPEQPEGRGQFGFAPTLGPLAWHIIRASHVTIFLLDGAQGFRDRENTTFEDIRRWADELGAAFHGPVSLAGTQFRCAGAVEYVEWVDRVLAGAPADECAALARLWKRVLDVRIVETPAALERTLRGRVAQGRGARLVASYAREWKTRGNARPHELAPEQLDFHERYRDAAGRWAYWSKPWNHIPQNGSDYTWFIQAPTGSPMHADPLCEVGCPYAVRGFDFDYVGVLWLGDLQWRGSHWTVDLASVHDTGLTHSLRAARAEGKRGPDHAALLRALAQAYRILLTRGIQGTYLWFEDDETRDYLRACLAD